jgi:hypothetical protein
MSGEPMRLILPARTVSLAAPAADSLVPRRGRYRGLVNEESVGVAHCGPRRPICGSVRIRQVQRVSPTRFCYGGLGIVGRRWAVALEAPIDEGTAFGGALGCLPPTTAHAFSLGSGGAGLTLVSEVQTDHDAPAAVRARPWEPLARDRRWPPA